MSLSRRQQKLIEIALDRLDTVTAARSSCEYILDQLVEGASPEYHGGERPPRDDDDVTALLATLRIHMPGLPKLSNIPLDNGDDDA